MIPTASYFLGDVQPGQMENAPMRKMLRTRALVKKLDLNTPHCKIG
jgi:hypothetical protein